MRSVLLCAIFAAQAFGADALDAFGHTWKLPAAADWKLEASGDTPILQLLTLRPLEKIRKPTQVALTDTSAFQRVTVELEVKREESKEPQSVVLVYAYLDPDHFNYVRLSSVNAEQSADENGVFHVYGGEGVRISPEGGPATLPSADWTKIRLAYDTHSGIVSVSVNGQSEPSLEAVDLSLSKGMIGLGSASNPASFRKVKITGLL